MQSNVHGLAVYMTLSGPCVIMIDEAEPKLTDWGPMECYGLNISVMLLYMYTVTQSVIHRRDMCRDKKSSQLCAG